MAVGNADDKYSMQKLEGPSNWQTWKIQIKAVLIESYGTMWMVQQG